MKKASTLGVLALLYLVPLTASITPACAQASSFSFSGVTPNTAPAGGAPAGDALAPSGHYTAGDGDAGASWNNAPTSDATMTSGNQSNGFYVAPPSTTTTSPTAQSTYQGITAGNPVGTGLVAPLSTLQLGNTRNFGGEYTFGFSTTDSVSLAGSGYNVVPLVPFYLPSTGTGEVYADTTIDGGY